MRAAPKQGSQKLVSGERPANPRATLDAPTARDPSVYPADGQHQHYPHPNCAEAEATP